MPKRIEFKPNEFYRCELDISGLNMQRLEERRKKLKRIRRHESSFLVNELLSDFFDNDQPFSAPLNGEKWLPKNQSEVTNKTLKVKS